MQTESDTLTRAQVRRVFARHKGAAADLARELGIHRARISKWMAGIQDSRPLTDAIHRKALALLEQEREHAGSAA